MKLSSRSKYGFRAALELAMIYGKGPLQIKSIAEKEEISSKYLEQLITMMKLMGLVRSVRGPKGGYVLAKPPKDILLSDVFRTLEGPSVTADCPRHSRFAAGCVDCVAKEIWGRLQKSLLDVMQSYSLQDLVDMSHSSAKKGGRS